jgi:hypothetical protein
MPCNRSTVIERQLANAERDLAYTTLWLSQCDDPRYPLAARNCEHFLKLRQNANHRYARALALRARLKPQTLRNGAQMEMLL